MPVKKTVKLYETIQGKAPVEKFLRSLTTKELSKALAAFRYVEQTEVVPAASFARW